MPSGIETARENVRKFKTYWDSLRAKDEYLPLKKDGTIWVDKVAADAEVGKSALRQNPALKELYTQAASETLEEHRKIVEAQLGDDAGEEVSKIEAASVG